MTRVILDMPRKPFTDDRQIVAVAAPAEILTILEEINVGKHLCGDSIPPTNGT